MRYSETLLDLLRIRSAAAQKISDFNSGVQTNAGLSEERRKCQQVEAEYLAHARENDCVSL